MFTDFDNSTMIVKAFPGANVKVPLLENPDHILFRVGTNELSPKNLPKNLLLNC